MLGHQPLAIIPTDENWTPLGGKFADHSSIQAWYANLYKGKDREVGAVYTPLVGLTSDKIVGDSRGQCMVEACTYTPSQVDPNTNEYLIVRGSIGALYYAPWKEKDAKTRYFMVLPYPHTFQPWFAKFFGILFIFLLYLGAMQLPNKVITEGNNKFRIQEKANEGEQTLMEKLMDPGKMLSKENRYWVAWAMEVYGTVYFIADYYLDVLSYFEMKTYGFRIIALLTITSQLLVPTRLIFLDKL